MKRSEKFVIKCIEIGSNFGELLLTFILAEPTIGTAVCRNIKYGDSKGYKRSKLDIYYPTERALRKKKTENRLDNAAGFPVLIYIHGGGFLSGRRSMRRFYCNKWVKLGFKVVNVDYDYGVDYPFPSNIRQTFKAIEWIIEHKDEYSFDLNRVVIAGDSAGAFIASYVAMLQGNPDLLDKLRVEFKYRDIFDIKACLLLSGLYQTQNALDLGFLNIQWFLMAFSGKGMDELRDYLATARMLSPIDYIDDRYPPSVVVRSEHDALSRESLLFADALKYYGVECLEFNCKGVSGVHAGALFTRSKYGKECLRVSQEFILNILDNNI